MYLHYKKARTGSKVQYDKENEVSLFGSDKGVMPKLLQRKLNADDSQPMKWHINVAAELCELDGYHQDSALVIDLKPDSKLLSLYEVMDVWGHSSSGWSPIMLRLTGLFVDADPGSESRCSFTRNDGDLIAPIYTSLYANGSIKDGKIWKKWSPPPCSSTNSVLLWPETLNYFVQCIHKTTPGIIDSV